MQTMQALTRPRTRGSSLSRTTISAAALAVLAGAACAVRLGGPGPQEYRTLAIEAPPSSSAADIARTVKESQANVVLLAADQDTAWFTAVSTETGLALSGPSTTERTGKAFLTNLKVLGDTSIVLGVADGSRMHMHDALYEISEERHLDLMLVGLSDRSDLREAVRTLLSYIATDVGPNAAVMIAIDAPTPAAGDSVATLLRAAYTNALECVQQGTDGPSRTRQTGTVRLFYGPSARVRCSQARTLEASGDPILAQLIVSR
jgi:hypothetical protein